MATVEVNGKEELRSPREQRVRRRVWIAGAAVLAVIAVIASLAIKVDRRIRAEGYVIASETSQLRPAITAAVGAIHFPDGAQVQAGDTVISLRLTATADPVLGELKAPHAGQLYLHPVHADEVVPAGALLGEIFGGERQVLLRVQERDLPKLAVAQPVTIRLAARDGVVTGAIARIDTVIKADRRAGYCETICRISTQDLPVGAGCRAEIVIGRGSLLGRILNR